MITSITLAATGSYVRFVGQTMEMDSSAVSSGALIEAHTIEFSDGQQRFYGTTDYDASHVNMQTGFPVLYPQNVAASTVTRYGAFLTAGTFSLRARVTEDPTYQVWSTSALATVTVLAKQQFPDAYVPLPDVGMDTSINPRVASTKFDDGYEQRISVGLNSISETISAKWTKLPKAQADTLLAFLEAHRSSDWFYWRNPSDLIRKKWRSGPWRKSDEAAGYITVSTTFERVYDPA